MMMAACFLGFPLHVLLLVWSDLLLLYLLWPVCAFTASSTPPHPNPRPNPPFVITAKPEPFVTIHSEQLLFFPHMHIQYTHTHNSSLFTHKCHTHFIVLHIVLICVSTREKKNALRQHRKSTVSKAAPEVSKKNFCICFDLSSHVGVTHESYLGGTIVCLFYRNRELDRKQGGLDLSLHVTQWYYYKYPQVISLFTHNVSASCLLLWRITSC